MDSTYCCRKKADLYIDVYIHISYICICMYICIYIYMLIKLFSGFDPIQGPEMPMQQGLRTAAAFRGVRGLSCITSIMEPNTTPNHTPAAANNEKNKA